MNIAREAGRRTMAIGIFIKGRDIGSVVKDMQVRVEQNVKLPVGYTVGWSGEFENQERAIKRLELVVPISLLLIFVLLFDAFKSFKMATLILMNVPLALIGGFVAPALRHEHGKSRWSLDGVSVNLSGESVKASHHNCILIEHDRSGFGNVIPISGALQWQEVGPDSFLSF